MASNVVAEDSSSDVEVKTDLNNISETSDEWSDIDDSELLLLDNAAEVVQSITPIKKSKKVSTNSQRKGIAKKQTILKKTEIEASNTAERKHFTDGRRQSN